MFAYEWLSMCGECVGVIALMFRFCVISLTCWLFASFRHYYMMDALTQAVVIGGWKKAGLSHETFASVLPTLPKGERILPTSTTPYICSSYPLSLTTSNLSSSHLSHLPSS